MATQALYNKWRGQTFDDILGQEHITRTLKNQLRAERVGHAYLFTGLRGTGKTSTARILAKAVNCVGGVEDPPCNQCPICRSITAGRSLDLIEIDAASNRGIDEIRDLRDGVNFSPHESRYKVHVIDEVHMLTNEAFNALLKTLEEPPAHVIFILCTTEPHRLPDTILSRCQRFDFRRGSVDAVLEKLRFICEREEIRISAEALEMIARRGGGSFRDAESLLDQLATYGSTEIGGELVQSVLGSVASATILGLVRSLITADAQTGLRLINEAIDNGAEPRQFLGEILDHLRALLLIRVGSQDNLYYLSEDEADALQQLAAEVAPPPGTLTRAIRLFNEAMQGLRNAPRPQLPLELAFIEALLQQGQLAVSGAVSDASATPQAAPQTATRSEQQLAETQSGYKQHPEKMAPVGDTESEREATGTTAQHDAPAPVTQVEETPAKSAAAPETAQESAAMVAPTPANEKDTAKTGVKVGADASEPAECPSLSLDWVQSRWHMIMTKVKARNLQVHALLNSTYPIAVRDDQITLACEASFHRDMLADDKRLSILEEAASEVLERSCRVQCVLDAESCRAAQGHDGGGGTATGDGNTDLFAAPPERLKSQSVEKPPIKTENSESKDARHALLNHPAVKRLEERGGRVVNVTLSAKKGES